MLQTRKAKQSMCCGGGGGAGGGEGGSGSVWQYTPPGQSWLLQLQQNPSAHFAGSRGAASLLSRLAAPSCFPWQAHQRSHQPLAPHLLFCPHCGQTEVCCISALMSSSSQSSPVLTNSQIPVTWKYQSSVMFEMR